MDEPENIGLMVFECLERLKAIEAQLTQEKVPMIKRDLEAKVNGLFDRIIARGGRWLPWRGRYLNEMRTFVLANLELLETTITNIVTGADFETSVSQLVAFVRGNISLPWPGSMVKGIILSSVERWLLDANNRQWIVEGIGALPPSDSK